MIKDCINGLIEYSLGTTRWTPAANVTSLWPRAHKSVGWMFIYLPGVSAVMGFKLIAVMPY